MCREWPKWRAGMTVEATKSQNPRGPESFVSNPPRGSDALAACEVTQLPVGGSRGLLAGSASLMDQAIREEDVRMVVTLKAPGIDPSLVLAPLAMMPSDPTMHLGPHEAIRATYTPEGPGVVRLAWGQQVGQITVEASGDGVDWLVEQAPRLVGAYDDVDGFAPSGQLVQRLWMRFKGDRVGATGTVWHDLAWTITQQRVHRADAARQWRALVHAYGAACDGHDNLYTPPDPERLARAAPWSLRTFGIDERRATALIAAARVAQRLHALTDQPYSGVERGLRTIPGVGPWTLGCLRAFTWGDPDTVIPGDSGIPSLIASTLTGARRADDATMLELLEPYRPHRYRVLRLALAARTRR